MDSADEYQYKPLESDRHIRLLKIPRGSLWKETGKAVVRLMGKDIEKQLQKHKKIASIQQAIRVLLYTNRFVFPAHQRLHEVQKKLAETAKGFVTRARTSDEESELFTGFDIFHVSLDSAPPFEAVSYTWGSCESAAKIAVSRLGNIHITKNLSEALPHLIKQSCTQLLWIDQICIDQKNEQERGHQVKLMRDIYKGACTTLIWLNPHHTDFETAREHGRLALRTLEASIGKLGSTYFHAVPFRKILGGFRVDLEDRVLAHMVDLRRLLSPEFKKALTEVLQRPWFSRGWIVQEFVFSRNPIFILHNQTMRNAQLEGLVSLAYAIGMTDLGGEVGATVKSLRELRAMLKEEQPPRWMVLLWTLNTFGESYGTAELRDRIFAYLGIWKPDEFEPDYGQPIERIFQDFIMHIAQETNSLEFLGSVSMDCERRFAQLSSLPSWVPDWTARVQEPSTVWLYFSADYGESRTRRWNACRSRKHFHCELTIGNQMIVRGKIFDQGVAVSDKRISEYITDRGFQHITTTKQRAPSLLHGLTRLDILNAIWGLIITPDCPNEARRRDPFGRKLQALSPKEVLDHLDNRWHIQDGYRAHPGTPMWDKDAMVESLLKTVCCRRLMATTGGRIAWVRSCCEEGDFVAIIHGCSVPMVLRKTDEPGCTYKVVGDCYIDGIMDGEAVEWGELDADEIVLV